MSTPKTDHLAARSALHVAAPMPDAAPVTIAPGMFHESRGAVDLKLVFTQ